MRAYPKGAIEDLDRLMLSVEMLVKDAYAAGRRRGASMLHQLADGLISPDEFAKKSGR